MFRFHLSTAFLIMLCASAIIGVNLHQYPAYFDDMSNGFLIVKCPEGDGGYTGNGWPWGFYGTGGRFGIVWDYRALLLDGVIAIGILMVVARLAEWGANRYYSLVQPKHSDENGIQ